MFKEFLLNLQRDRGDRASHASQSQFATKEPTESSLPVIDLTDFHGAIQYWVYFRESFTQMVVNNKNLTSVHKLRHLKTHLKGEAV